MNGSLAIGSRLLVPLERALDPRAAGGKGSNLSKLIGLGFPVPPGFVLTCEAFERFLAVDRLGAGIEALQRRLDPADPAGRREVSHAIRAQVIGGALPADVLEALDAAARELPAQAGLAVRSSAVGEDGAAASFAGQFDSVLHVDSVEALRRAVRVCWASYWSERSLCYRAARNARLGGMAVVLQRQVSARVSGVLFTRAPAGTPGAAGDDLVIECCPDWRIGWCRVRCALMRADGVLPFDIRPAAAPRAAPRAGRVLLTGATGFLGAHLLGTLLEETDAEVLCLVRDRGSDGESQRRVRRSLERYRLWDDTFDGRVHTVTGDLSQPSLGLAADVRATLESAVDAIYHAAADVDWVAGAVPGGPRRRGATPAPDSAAPVTAGGIAAIPTGIDGSPRGPDGRQGRPGTPSPVVRRGDAVADPALGQDVGRPGRIVA